MSLYSTIILYMYLSKLVWIYISIYSQVYSIHTLTVPGIYKAKWPALATSFLLPFSIVEDFNNAPEEYVFTPATSSADVDVAIEITDDSIQEVNEIFLVVLEVVIINDQDKAGLILSRNVSIGRIRLDPSDGKL